MLELTVPDERRFADSNKLKRDRYAELIDECKGNGWSAHLYCFEVGTRGFLGDSTSRLLRDFGLPRALRFTIQHTALRSSYTIYIHRKERAWTDWELVSSPPASKQK